MGNRNEGIWTPEVIRHVFYAWLQHSDLGKAPMYAMILRNWALKTGRTMEEAFTIERPELDRRMDIDGEVFVRLPEEGPPEIIDPRRMTKGNGKVNDG